jgi:ESCRT-I complex subunit VPS37
LKDKSADELNRLLTDKDAYNKFLHSLDEVRRLEKISDELRRSTIDESRNNLAKESEISELRTQCMIIRNTELAASQEKFDEFEKRYKEVQANCSPDALLRKLQDAANEADEESENYHRKFLNGEIELLEYIQKYRKQRLLYHKRSLIRMAALTSLTTPG